MNTSFSLRRPGAMIRKEFIQMRRDRLTFAMMPGLSAMLLVLGKYAATIETVARVDSAYLAPSSSSCR